MVVVFRECTLARRRSLGFFHSRVVIVQSNNLCNKNLRQVETVFACIKWHKFLCSLEVSGPFLRVPPGDLPWQEDGADDSHPLKGTSAGECYVHRRQGRWQSGESWLPSVLAGHFSFKVQCNAPSSRSLLCFHKTNQELGAFYCWCCLARNRKDSPFLLSELRIFK